MLGIADYFWRLLPGNPILLRVVQTAGKKRRDAIIRCGYLGLLVVMVTWILSTSGTSYGSSDLAALTKDSALIFQYMSYLQLALVALLSPVFTAGAITQERDSQTYDILLATPLTNGQIVLGSLLSRVFFVVALLVSGIPIFSITQIFGGVAIKSIFYSFLIAASTALVTGAMAMAMAIATLKVGTRRTIFSFYLFIVIYLVGFYLLDSVDFMHLHYVDAAGNPHTTQTSWLTGLHPFLALRVIFNDANYLPPNLADLPGRWQSWPYSWYWTSPATFYFSFMLIASVALVLPSILLLRRMAQSTSGFKNWVLQKIHIGGGATRKPRSVWYNPIAWREARTKASAGRASFLRYGFILLGLSGSILLLTMHATEGSPHQFISSGYDATRNMLFIDGDTRQDLAVSPYVQVKIGDRDGTTDDLNGRYEVKDFTLGPGNSISQINLRDFPRRLDSEQTRTWLLGVTILEFSVILLIITNAAASTVTREKEDGTLDLLLSTPITSRYYIWGKLRGLVSFVLPLLAVPVVSCFLFIAHDLLRWLAEGDSRFQWIVFPEALLMMPSMLIIVCAFAAILGMQMSLRCRTTVRAVMSSVGIIVGACALLGWCGNGILNSRSAIPELSVGAAVFSPFTMLTLLIDPYDFGGRAYDPLIPDADPEGARVTALVMCIVVLCVYALLVWSMYKSMVKNFDMTIRKQSR
ncbi:MAG: ABC transporter permease subunit [Tepidisphaeraceae bacterium]|jgi:ABC-type transport system involved in multi-copper enzyme maturation permease subunit